MTVASVPSTLLREPQRFISELKAGVGLGEKAWALAIISFLFFGIYGSVLGASSGFLQSLVSALKLPLLFLLTMAVCLPTLHILNLLFGARHTLGQVAVLLLAALAATGTVLVGFLPISAFFLMTNDSYAFFKLLNVAIIGVSAFYGVKFLSAGMRHLHDGLPETGSGSRGSVLQVWILLYAFVGSQLAWVVRPFFGSPDMPFQLFRAERGNFFIDVIRSIQTLMGIG